MMGTYELVLRSEFSASHSLRLADGRHEPMHSHNWRVEVFLESARLDDAGFVLDFTAVHQDLAAMTGELEGTCLNELPTFSGRNPSTERVAKHLHDRLRPKLPRQVWLAMVRVWETPACAAAYVPSLIESGEAGSVTV